MLLITYTNMMLSRAYLHIKSSWNVIFNQQQDPLS